MQLPPGIDLTSRPKKLEGTKIEVPEVEEITYSGFGKWSFVTLITLGCSWMKLCFNKLLEKLSIQTRYSSEAKIELTILDRLIRQLEAQDEHISSQAMLISSQEMRIRSLEIELEAFRNHSRTPRIALRIAGSPEAGTPESIYSTPNGNPAVHTVRSTGARSTGARGLIYGQTCLAIQKHNPNIILCENCEQSGHRGCVVTAALTVLHENERVTSIQDPRAQYILASLRRYRVND